MISEEAEEGICSTLVLHLLKHYVQLSDKPQPTQHLAQPPLNTQYNDLSFTSVSVCVCFCGSIFVQTNLSLRLWCEDILAGSNFFKGLFEG